MYSANNSSLPILNEFKKEPKNLLIKINISMTAYLHYAYCLKVRYTCQGKIYIKNAWSQL